MTMDRRNLLKLGSASTLGLLAACNGYKAASSATPSLAKSTQPFANNLGVQLYTFRELYKTDYKAVLKILADAGYKDLEFAGYAEHDPREIKAYMDDLGLVSRSSHIQLKDMRENFGQVMETAKLMGQEYLVIPWLAPEARTIDNYKSIAELMNKHGEVAKKADLNVAYHNHDFEFDTIDGQVPYDILLAETDPDLTTMEIDFFWSHKAGIDPLELFKKAPGRFFGSHVKDSNAAGQMVPVGSGVIDFQTIFDNAELAGMTKFYVEDDTATDPKASVIESIRYLSTL